MLRADTFQLSQKRPRKRRKPEHHELAGELQEVCSMQDPRSSCEPLTKRPEAAIWTIEVSWEILQDVISVAA